MNAKTLFPFLRWFPLTSETLRADLIAGITIALILVPQSMAYAQLAGLPVVYGLYAAFIPGVIASMWGSSSQLHTGPVAMLSLMSAAAILPFAAPGSPSFIELSVMLALLVGVLRLGLGLFKLGAIVNLLSSPVIVGFTNAAALIIGFSQLSKIIGVPFPRSDLYLEDLWHVAQQIGETHWPTLLFAVGAYAAMVLLKKFAPKIPGVLVAVLGATAISAMIGFENKADVDLGSIADPAIAQKISEYANNAQRIKQLIGEVAEQHQLLSEIDESQGHEAVAQAAIMRGKQRLLDYELGTLKEYNNALQISLYRTRLASTQVDGSTRFYEDGAVPQGVQTDGDKWRFIKINGNTVTLSSGGAVVGEIPEGLPAFAIPHMDLQIIIALLPAAMVMALIGFMEATSISKAIATTTGERVDASKELIGQGLANIVGSFFSSYTVSGSFSRSAVAAKTGAKTGVFAVVAALAVLAVLLFFTKYLHALPQAVLAVIVMMAVFGLVRIEPLVHAWKVDRAGAIIGILTFFATLIMAPAIANGILLGVALTVIVCLIKSMRPRAEIVSRKQDGSLGGITANKLEPISNTVVPVRFDGSLTFSTVAYFEDIVIEAVANFPDVKAILVIGSGINEIDASGEERVLEVARQLQRNGVQLCFSGLKYQVRSVFERTAVYTELGEENFFPYKELALKSLLDRYDEVEPGTATTQPA